MTNDLQTAYALYSRYEAISDASASRGAMLPQERKELASIASKLKAMRNRTQCGLALDSATETLSWVTGLLQYA